MRRTLLLLCTPLALACSGILYEAPPCSGEVLDPGSASPRRLHVRVLLDHDGREQRHELVLDQEPGRVVAVGLTPVGTVAYRLTHDAEGVVVDNGVGRFMGLDPDLAYDAVVRALLLPAAPTGTGSASGEATSLQREECRYAAQLFVVSDRTPRTPAAPAAP